MNRGGSRRHLAHARLRVRACLGSVDDANRIIARLKAKGLGVLITDHNVRETLSSTDRAFIMFEGRIVLSGTARELADDPTARRIYLGEKFQL